MSVLAPVRVDSCTRDAIEQEVAYLERRLRYPGGRKARRAEKRLRELDWFLPSRYLEDSEAEDK